MTNDRSVFCIELLPGLCKAIAEDPLVDFPATQALLEDLAKQLLVTMQREAVLREALEHYRVVDDGAYEMLAGFKATPGIRDPESVAGIALDDLSDQPDHWSRCEHGVVTCCQCITKRESLNLTESQRLEAIDILENEQADAVTRNMLYRLYGTDVSGSVPADEAECLRRPAEVALDALLERFEMRRRGSDV